MTRVSFLTAVLALRTITASFGSDLSIPPAGSIPVAGEKYVLASDRPNKWGGGTHLKQVLAPGGTALPGCLVPGSVVVRLDGRVMERDKDYFLDEHWAGLSRLPEGRIPQDATVAIDYAFGLMRLDTIEVSRDGTVATLVRTVWCGNSPTCWMT